MEHRAAAVASRGIELALQREPFTADDVRRGVDDPPSRATVYRVLPSSRKTSGLSSGEMAGTQT